MGARKIKNSLKIIPLLFLTACYADNIKLDSVISKEYEVLKIFERVCNAKPYTYLMVQPHVLDYDEWKMTCRYNATWAEYDVSQKSSN